MLLYYSDFQTKLRELYFLNPEWLCMLMAQIITIPEINPFITKEGVRTFVCVGVFIINCFVLGIDLGLLV